MGLDIFHLKGNSLHFASQETFLESTTISMIMGQGADSFLVLALLIANTMFDSK